MSLYTTCTACGSRQPIAAGFEGEDGKRLAVLFGDMPPVLARAVIEYLGLFKPPKTALRTATAVKRVQELMALIKEGSVTKDGRTGVRRPASPELWAVAIETMVTQRQSLTLPLDGHGYLRAVAFGLADKADAQAEQKRETDRQRGGQRNISGTTTEDPVTTARRFAANMLSLGTFSAEQHDAYIAEAAARQRGSAP